MGEQDPWRSICMAYCPRSDKYMKVGDETLPCQKLQYDEIREMSCTRDALLLFSSAAIITQLDLWRRAELLNLTIAHGY